MEWLELAFKIAAKLGEVIIGAISRGDTAVLDQKIGDVLGHELRTTLARRAADAEAVAKFGGAAAFGAVATVPYWMIERRDHGPAEWWNRAAHTWVIDANAATHFPTEEAALREMGLSIFAGLSLVATHHMNVSR